MKRFSPTDLMSIATPLIPIRERFETYLHHDDDAREHAVFACSRRWLSAFYRPANCPRFESARSGGSLTRMLISWVGSVCLAITTFAATDGPLVTSGVEEFQVWPGTAPGSEPENLPAKNYVEIWSGSERPVGRETVKQISVPTLAYFPANQAKSKGSALIIAPGGGYNLLAINHEGWEVARHFASEGIACFVLKYRHFDRAIALRDAHRAIRLVRHRAAEWKVDPRRIGFGGFSAGGHLSLNAAANRSASEPWTHDEIDRASNTIDFLMLIYPSSIERLPAGSVIDAQFPPVFLVNAAGDNVGERALPLVRKLESLRLRFEAHIFAAGTHGGGFYQSIPSTSVWPQLFLRWFDEQLAPEGGMRSPKLPPLNR